MAEQDRRTRMRAAIEEVRREGVKVALIYAIIDAAIVSLASAFVIGLIDYPLLQQSIRPGTRFSAVDVGAVINLVVGVVAFGIEFTYRIRQPIVERFEAANPSVSEALRTARDTVAEESESVVAHALYEDVITRLRSTSSHRLLNTRRLAGSVGVILLLSFLTLQASVAAIDIEVGETGPDGPISTPDAGDAVETPTDDDLQPGEDILGDPETITPGSDNLTAPIDTGVGGTGGTEDIDRQYDQSGIPNQGAPAIQQAGYDPPPDFEEAELIRAYNLRIRGATESETDQ